jgi:3-phosphoglycerate kinase
MILDCGPKTVELLAGYVSRANAVLWNGPLGAYEQGFVEGTEGLAMVAADSDARVRGVVNYKADPLRLSVRCTISSA